MKSTSILRFSKNNIVTFLFFIICFFITRQFPFSDYSIISNIALLGIIILYPPKSRLHLFYIAILTSLFFYSFSLGNNIGNILRFYIILYVIAAAYSFKYSIKIISVLFYVVLFHSILVITFEVYMILFTNNEQSSFIRHYFLSRNWGDIYTYDGIFYRIQLKGNGILPFVYMLTYAYTPFKKYNNLFQLILFLSIICSGHFAFLIVITLFHIFNYLNIFKKDAKLFILRIYFLLLCFFTSSAMIIDYIRSVLQKKAENSNATRFDQLEVLYTDLSDNFISLFFGRGIGHTLTKVTSYRDYNDLVYYELQIVYILNQLGIIFFILLIIYLSIITFKKIKYKDLLYIYLFYIIYASTNPYIFDTNHFIVIASLCCISNYRQQNSKYLSLIQ